MVVVVGGSLSLLSLCSRHKKAQQMYLIVSGVLVLVLGSRSLPTRALLISASFLPRTAVGRTGVYKED